MRLIKPRAHSATKAFMVAQLGLQQFTCSRLAMNRFRHYKTLNANQMLNVVVNNGFDVAINYWVVFLFNYCPWFKEILFGQNMLRSAISLTGGILSGGIMSWIQIYNHHVLLPRMMKSARSQSTYDYRIDITAGRRAEWLWHRCTMSRQHPTYWLLESRTLSPPDRIPPLIDSVICSNRGQ